MTAGISYSLSDAQNESLQISASVCGLISLISVTYCMFDMYMKYRAGNRGFTLQMQMVLMCFNLATAFAGTFGEVAQLDPFFCLFQGFVMQFAALGTLLWSNVIAWNMYQWIVYNRRLEVIKSNLPRDACIVAFISFLPAICLLGTDDYEPAGPWCWIAKTHPAQRYGLLFIPLLISYCHCLWTVWYIRKIMTENARVGDEATKLNPNDQLVFNQLAGIVLVYLVAYFFPLINRSIEAGTGGGHVFFFEIVQTISVLMQGFINALIYKGAIVYISQKTNTEGKNVKFRLISSKELGGSIDACPLSRLKDEDTAEYSVFTTTYNVGEAPVNELVPFFGQWLFRGHDIYCINVQECMEFDALKEAVWAHMGGSDLYYCHSDAIGSDIKAAGYHGYIGLIILISQDHVKSGAVRINACASPKVATGTNLGFATAENKGAVGVPLQINELSVVFLGSHLPSDEKGKCKVHIRNTASHNILNDLNALTENSGISLEYEHHAIFFMGDLNYRMTEDLFNHAAYNSALIKVANAAAIEAREIGSKGSDEARQMNYMERRKLLLRHASDPLHPSPEEITLLNMAMAVAEPAWAAVTESDDELIQAMASGASFATWKEPLIMFPPTYKKFTGPPRPGPNGELGLFPDYLEPTIAAETYSHYLKFEGDMSGLVDTRDTTDDEFNRSVSAAQSGFNAPPKTLNDVEGELAGLGRVKPRRFTGTDNLDNGTGTQGKESANVIKFKKKRRNPSYCDRILYHIHQDVHNAQRYEVKSYNMLDNITCSDHRPVSAVSFIRANKNLLFPRNFMEKTDQKSLQRDRKGSIQLTKQEVATLSKKGGKGAASISVLDIRGASSSAGKSDNDKTTIVGHRFFLYELEVEDLEVAMEIHLDTRIEKLQLDQRRKNSSPDGSDSPAATNPIHSSNNMDGLSRAEQGIPGVDDDDEDDEIPPNTRKWRQDNKYRDFKSVTHATFTLGLPSCNPLFKEQHNNMRLVDLLNIDEYSMTTLLSPNTESVALQNLYDSRIGPKLNSKRNRLTVMFQRSDVDGTEPEVDGEGGSQNFKARPSVKGKRVSHLNFAIAADATVSGASDDCDLQSHSLLKPSFTVTMDKTDDVLPLGVPPNSPQRASTMDGSHRPSYQSTGSIGTQEYTQSLSAAPRVSYKTTRRRQRLVGVLNPCMGAHVIVKFLHGSSEDGKLGECCITLTHLMEKSATRSVDSVLRGGSRTVRETDANSPLDFIDDIPVTLGGLFCGTARGKFALRFLGAAEREE